MRRMQCLVAFKVNSQCRSLFSEQLKDILLIVVDSSQLVSVLYIDTAVDFISFILLLELDGYFCMTCMQSVRQQCSKCTV